MRKSILRVGILNTPVQTELLRQNPQILSTGWEKSSKEEQDGRFGVRSCVAQLPLPTYLLSLSSDIKPFYFSILVL